jgi:hypothetical protein
VASGNMTHQRGYELISPCLHRAWANTNERTNSTAVAATVGGVMGIAADARVWLTCMMDSLTAWACAWIRHDKRTGASSVMRS